MEQLQPFGNVTTALRPQHKPACNSLCLARHSSAAYPLVIYFHAKVSLKDFDMMTAIGEGAFGKVQRRHLAA